jgi:hypothetical protein
MSQLLKSSSFHAEGSAEWLILLWGSLWYVFRYATPPIVTGLAWREWTNFRIQQSFPEWRKRLAFVSIILCTVSLILWGIDVLIPTRFHPGGVPAFQPRWVVHASISGFFLVLISTLFGGFAKGKMRDYLLSSCFLQLFFFFTVMESA